MIPTTRQYKPLKLKPKPKRNGPPYTKRALTDLVFHTHARTHTRARTHTHTHTHTHTQSERSILQREGESAKHTKHAQQRKPAWLFYAPCVDAILTQSSKEHPSLPTRHSFSLCLLSPPSCFCTSPPPSFVWIFCFVCLLFTGASTRECWSLNPWLFFIASLSVSLCFDFCFVCSFA